MLCCRRSASIDLAKPERPLDMRQDAGALAPPCIATLGPYTTGGEAGLFKSALAASNPDRSSINT